MDTLLTPTFAPLLIILEACAILGVIQQFKLIARNYAALPATVPMKFSASGDPQTWQGKAMLWFLPGTALFLYLMLTTLAVIIPLDPQGYHGLARPLTPELLGQMNRATVFMLELLKVEMIALFLYLTHNIINIAAGKTQRINSWHMLRFLFIIFASIGLNILYVKFVLQL